MEELNIKPIWNVPYSPDFNSAVEVSAFLLVNLLKLYRNTGLFSNRGLGESFYRRCYSVLIADRLL